MLAEMSDSVRLLIILFIFFMAFLAIFLDVDIFL